MKRKLLLATLTASLTLSGCSNTKSTPEVVKQNQASSQYDLAYNYQNGNGVPQNYSKAVSLYLKSAAQGYVRAQTNLGLMYEYGDGLTQRHS